MRIITNIKLRWCALNGVHGRVKGKIVPKLLSSLLSANVPWVYLAYGMGAQPVRLRQVGKITLSAGCHLGVLRIWPNSLIVDFEMTSVTVASGSGAVDLRLASSLPASA